MIDFTEIDDRIAKCEKILEANQQSQIFAALADAYRKKGNLQKAEEVCLAGLELHSDYASARVVMAKIFMAREMYNAAFEELKKAIGLAGRTRIIDVIEAEIHIRQGRKSEATAILTGLAATDPSDENVKELMAMLEKSEHETTSNIPISQNPAPIPIIEKSEPPPLSQVKLNFGEKREMSLPQAISILKIMPRVLGVMAISHDGMILEARFDGIPIKEEFAALSKVIFDSSSACSQKINLGSAQEILIETSANKLWVFYREKFLLMVISRDDVSMGALRLRIDELFHCIEFQGSEAVTS
jgi:predicted regulator of Ras-like GTPase activity (Roadblock/LC7/MglB family)